MPRITRTLTLDDGREFRCQEAVILDTRLGIELDRNQFTIQLWCEYPAATTIYIPVESNAVPGDQVLDEIKAILDIVGVPFWEGLKDRSILVLFNPEQTAFRAIVGIASLDGTRVHFAETEIRQGQLA